MLALACCSITLVALADELDVPDAAEPCLACHAFERDEPALVGPPLWGIVGRPIASSPGYDYSDALRSLGGSWDRERLDRFIAAPQEFAPGVKMTFGGLRNADQRKIVLDFLDGLTPAGAAVQPAPGQ